MDSRNIQKSRYNDSDSPDQLGNALTMHHGQSSSIRRHQAFHRDPNLTSVPFSPPEVNVLAKQSSSCIDMDCDPNPPFLFETSAFRTPGCPNPEADFRWSYGLRRNRDFDPDSYGIDDPYLDDVFPSWSSCQMAEKQTQQNDTSVLNPDKPCLVDSSSSSLGLFHPRTPEPFPVFPRFPPHILRTPEAQRSQLVSVVDDVSPLSQSTSRVDAFTSPAYSDISQFTTAFDVSVSLPCKQEQLLAFNQRPIMDDCSTGPPDSQLWNLFEEDDPWNAIGAVLGLGLQGSITSSKSLEDEMRDCMTDDRHGVGYIPSGQQCQVSCLATGLLGDDSAGCYQMRNGVPGFENPDESDSASCLAEAEDIAQSEGFIGNFPDPDDAPIGGGPFYSEDRDESVCPQTMAAQHVHVADPHTSENAQCIDTQLRHASYVRHDTDKTPDRLSLLMSRSELGLHRPGPVSPEMAAMALDGVRASRASDSKQREGTTVLHKSLQSDSLDNPETCQSLCVDSLDQSGNASHYHQSFRIPVMEYENGGCETSQRPQTPVLQDKAEISRSVDILLRDRSIADASLMTTGPVFEETAEDQFLSLFSDSSSELDE